MKENLKIRVNSRDEKHEVQKLFFALGFNWQLFGAHNQVRDFTDSLITAYIDEMCIRQVACDKYFRDSPNKEITLPELRELARPKEYLNENYQLQVTNQPDDGFILVPGGAEYFVKGHGSEALFFYKQDGEYMAWKMPQGKNWIPSSHTSPTTAFIILWQRENKVETAKGRFLHQWAYEAFGRGEDVQYAVEGRHDFVSVSSNTMMSAFQDKLVKFRLKPQTIQIGSRTINKPISVKPEIGKFVYFVDLLANDKHIAVTWNDESSQNVWLNKSLCHLTAADVINHADALLELMK